jgi:hypothetical protein
LEVTVLRIVRIALFVLIPTFALATVVTGCGDDTTGTTPDMTTPVQRDMTTPPAHDMAHTD